MEKRKYYSFYYKYGYKLPEEKPAQSGERENVVDEVLLKGKLEAVEEEQGGFEKISYPEKAKKRGGKLELVKNDGYLADKGAA